MVVKYTNRNDPEYTPERRAFVDQKERKQYEQLILTPVQKLIPRLAIPTVFSMMITMIYNLVDAYFVGKLGTSASASIGILMSVQSIFQAAGFMFGHGAGCVISRLLGAGNKEEANRIASLAFASALVLSAALALPGLIFIRPLMRILGSTETILPYAMRYGFFILISGPALSLSCVLNNIMRYEGKAYYAMFGLVSGGVLNMIGDPVLMFGLNMGIVGAGLSTAASQYVSLMILWYMFASGRSISRIGRAFLGWDRDRFVTILQNGSPSLVRQGLNSVSTIVLNLSAGAFGDAAIAAMSIVGRVVMFIGSVMIGIGQALQPVAAYGYGAGKFLRIRETYRFTLILGEILMGSMAVIAAIVPSEIIRVFRDDPEVVRIGAAALRFQCASIVLQPMTVLGNMLFQSIGRSRDAAWMASFRSGLFLIPALLILPRLFGITGLECAQMVADILSALICVIITAAFFRTAPREDRRGAVDEDYERSVSETP